MADYVSTLRADTTQHDKALTDASKKVGDYKKETDKASASINGMKDATSRSTRELMKEMSSMENLGRSTSNYKRQLADLTKQISDLTINYRNMSDEQKNGAFGQEVAAKIEELKNKAAEYKDAIADVNAEINNMASDTAGWDGLKQGIDVASSSLQAFVSLGVIGEQSTERLVAVIARLKSIETIAAAAIKVGNALQRNSAMMKNISTLQTNMLAKAELSEAAATGKATIAQKGFNLVAKANPYVLLATAVIGVVTALAAFSKGQDEATKSMYNANEMNKAYKDKLNEVAGEVGLTIGKFESLKTQYEKLKSVGEKQEWINKNRTAFNDLGLSVTSVNDADNIFIKNSDKVIKAMQLRAQAAAIQQLYQEKYAEAYQKSIKVAEGRSSSFSPSTFFRGDWKKAGLGAGDYTMTTNTMPSTVGAISSTIYELTPEGVAKMQAYWKQQGANVMSSFTEGAAGMIDDMTAMIREAESLESSFKTTGGRGNGGHNNTTTTKQDEPPVVGSLAEANKMVSDLQKQLTNMNPNTEGFEEVKKQLEEWKQKQEELNEKINGTKKATKEEKDELEGIVNGSLAEANYWVRKLSADLENMDPNTEGFEKILELLKQWQKKQQDITDSINGTSKAVEKAKEGPYDKLIEKLGKVRDDSYSVVGSFNSIYDSFKNLSKEIEDAENGWEAFFAVFESGMTLLEGFSSMLTGITTLVELLTAAKKKENTEEVAGAAAATAATAAKTGEAAANASAAATSGAAAAAEAGKSVASIPVAGPFLAIAAIAAVMAAIIGIIAQAQSFADGGIISGSRSIGDYNIARVNSGEMILNGTQQSKLFNMINTGGLYDNGEGAGSVSFKIRGNDLVGVLNNYNQKLSKR